ncbi:protein kinase [Rhodococcus sp. NPDC057529]|uniref:protein kinase domain-containing protein n=1 Tax=Rhodococcus sp. NPDC057529 TaxID=3346158 RepID=UPI003671493C
MDESDQAGTERDIIGGIAAELEAEGFEHAEVVGYGGFGTVYRLDQPELRRTVAIKVLQSGIGRDSRARFLREQQAMGALSEHPNIVAILQAGITNGGHPYLVMPFYERGSLDARIRRNGPIGWKATLRMGIRIAGALETAHRASILHRDVKPSNILLTDYGEPALTDFGIARIEGGFETSASIITGTPAYTSPEILEGQSPTAASDVYALGATLYSTLTGHAAFERRSGEQAVAQLLRIMQGPVPSLRGSDIPDDLCSAIERAVARNPADRPQTAFELGEELRLVQRRHSLPATVMALPAPREDDDRKIDDILSDEEHPAPHQGMRGPSGPISMPLGPVTKYRPPKTLRRLVERQRLIDLLNTGGDRRLVVIHGPAGFGKSTLALQWSNHLTAQGTPVAWLVVDRDDNNVVWFLAHVIEAIRQVRPALAEESVRALEEHADDAERFVMTSLIDEVHAGGERLALVIDDWHKVTDTAAITALEYLIDNGCHHLQLIVTSRSRSGLPLSRTRVHDELVEIDPGALRFDFDESQNLLSGLGGLAVSAADIAQIVRSTDGWPAALQLAMLSLRGRDDVTAFIGAMTGRHRAIGDYLAENVLDSLEPTLLEFLLSICVTDRICADLAKFLTQGKYGGTLLEHVERSDLFLYRTDDDGDWYRFSSVFTEFLRARLERDQPERKIELHRLAFRWFADHRLLREAVDHALAAGENEQAVTLVENYGLNLVTRGQMASLLGLVEKLPPSEVGRRPRLQIVIAQANLSLHRSAAARSALDRAYSLLTRTPDPALSVLADVVQGVLDVTMDRIDNVDTLVSRCLDDPDAHSAWLVSLAANIKSFVRTCRFEFAAARDLQDWAIDYHLRAEGTFTQVYGYCYAGLAATEQLDVDAAERSFVKALGTARESMGPHSHAARMASSLLGELRYEQNRIEEAERLLDESHAMGSEIGQVDFMIAIYATGARLKAVTVGVGAAATLLDEGAKIAHTMNLPRLAARIDDERARYRLSGSGGTDRIPASIPAAAQSLHGVGIETITAQTVEAIAIRQLLRTHDQAHLDAACGRAHALVEVIDTHDRPRASLQARLLLSACLIQSGRHGEAEEILVPAAERCASLGLVRLLADAGPQVASAIARLLDADQLTGLREHRPLFQPIPD